MWCGSEPIETTVWVSACHWHRGLLCDAGYEREAVVAERMVYWVACAAALLDFREAAAEHGDLQHPTDYALALSIGARTHRQGHPGLVIQSARRPAGEKVATFNSGVLFNPWHACQLTYRLEGGGSRWRSSRRWRG